MPLKTLQKCDSIHLLPKPAIFDGRLGQCGAGAADVYQWC
jgi:hypothetical protein